MPRHLILRLEAPLMSFGGTMIDAYGPTRDVPIVSMVTGLIANALGWHRAQREQHADLQLRIVLGARLDRPGSELRDFQTAQLGANDKGWTTRGEPEGRAGGANTYKSPHIRERHYRADASVTIALRLEPADTYPTLEEVQAALAEPARPLFIGRKPCLPSRPLLSEPPIDATNVHDALRHAAVLEATASQSSVRVSLPYCDWPTSPEPRRIEMVADIRDWISGVHTGETRHGFFSIDRDTLPVLDGERHP